MAVPFTAIADALADIWGEINYLISFFNPFSDTFILKVAFIPGENYFKNYWIDINEAFNDKLPFLTDLKEMLTNIRYAAYGESKPEFTVKFNGKYGSGEYEIVNFDFFDEYRIYILNFIRFIAWFMFLKGLYRRIPNMIY